MVLSNVKIDEAGFFGKKWGISSVIKKWCLGFFRYFAWSYHNTLCFKKVNNFRKKNVKVEKKHCRISFCFWKVNVLPLVITLINNVKVSIEHVRCDSLKRYILSLFCISYVMSLFIKMRFITCSDSRTVIGNET